MAAFVLGIVQLVGVKGTTVHRTLGYVWAALMLVIAISSFWIQGLRQVGRQILGGKRKPIADAVL